MGVVTVLGFEKWQSERSGEEVYLWIDGSQSLEQLLIALIYPLRVFVHKLFLRRINNQYLGLTILCYDKHALRADAPIPCMFFSPLVL